MTNDYRILNRDGYFNRVDEMKQDNNDLTICNLWEAVENELSRFGVYRYSSYESFKDAYYKNIRNKKNNQL